MRAFLAIPVLPPALSVVQALRERLILEVAGVRWGPADSLHITLHFFGALSGADAERALDGVSAVIARRPPLLLRLDGLGSFPSARDPHVVWCGVDGDVDALAGLASDCRTTLRSLGFPADDRPFSPHCTLGRPRRPWGVEERQRWSDFTMERHVTPAFDADRVVLFESVTGRVGVRHVPRATLSLGVDAAPVVPQPAPT